MRRWREGHCCGGADENNSRRTPKFPPFSLKFQFIRYGPDENDCSAVLVRDTEDSQPTLGKAESVMLAILTTADKPLTHGEWRQAGIEADLSERTACRGIERLVKSGRVQKNAKTYVLVPKQEPEERA